MKFSKSFWYNDNNYIFLQENTLQLEILLKLEANISFSSFL